MQLVDVWAGRVLELAVGNAHVGIGPLIVLVVFGHSQGLDEGQFARDDGGLGGDNARKSDGEGLHCVCVCVCASLEVVCMEGTRGKEWVYVFGC